MKQIPILLMAPVVLFLIKCNNKKELISTSPIVDSTSAMSSLPEKLLINKPIDTIFISTTKKIQILILEYHESYPNKPIKSFEVRDPENNRSIFRSYSKQISLSDEIDHFSGDTDSIVITPAYYISSQNPLSIDLKFLIDGNLGIGFLEDLTCNLKFQPNDQTKKYIDFLSYNFILTNDKWIIESSIDYPPCVCNEAHVELLSRFNKARKEQFQNTEQSDELLKFSFICFINGLNPYYYKIINEFEANTGKSFSPYLYSTYVTYLDKFIINFNSTF